MISRGNHKSATIPLNEPTLIEHYKKEVDRGWMLPVTIERHQKLKTLASSQWDEPLSSPSTSKVIHIPNDVLPMMNHSPHPLGIQLTNE